MKVGLSTYSLSRAIRANEMDVLQAIEWIAANGGKHVEISPSGFTLTDNPSLVSAMVKKAKDCGLDISSYTIGANFVQGGKAERDAEVQRLKKEVDIAGALGVKRMRHDVAYRKPEESTPEQFEKDLPPVTEACREIADYAAQYGITTSVENHGYHFQHSERILRLVKAVGRDNFRTTVDLGNFVCVDEDPLRAVTNNAPFASMAHVKDFYLRDKELNPGEGFFRSSGGNYIRGAIVGQGDLDIRGCLKALKKAGYDGYLSIEFEGMEDCRTGSKIGMENVVRLWNEIA
ncbi:MAG: sugar phosphate isomerase [Lentisphaerae bacterium GWF2_52_8]|nr:MAG: sugar phosphate isomerase [Lentisphaerae bacterium GWF2_52_8]